MTDKINGRGKSPTPKQCQMLWGKAAGVCEYRGCGKQLTDDPLSKMQDNYAIIAHITASSPNGARGNEESHSLSQDLDNLMLMCYDHSHLIDHEGKEIHTVEILKEMKREHESKVEDLVKLLIAPETIVFAFQSPVRGCITEIDLKDAQKAIKDKYVKDVRKMNIASNYEYGTPEYWRDVESLLDRRMCEIKAIWEINPNSHVTMLPFAPMPLIIKLGFMLGDKVPADVQQLFRDTKTWEWKSEGITNSYYATFKQTESKSGNIALVFSLTAELDVEGIEKIMEFDGIYVIKAEHQGVNSISSQADLNNFWLEYQQICDRIVAEHGSNSSLHIFPCMPVSAAFEVGRRRMPNVYPQVTVYDSNNGVWVKTLELQD